MNLKTELGQFFTPDFVAQEMSNLIQNHGSLLEPSCGNGVFLQYLPKTAVAIEIDPDVAPKNAKIMDFFDWDEKVDTIIGNPLLLVILHILDSKKYQKAQNKNYHQFQITARIYFFFSFGVQQIC